QYYGGVAVRFPTLKIIGTNIKKVVLTIKKIKQYDFVIFISPNSVFNTAEAIHRIWCSHWPKETKVIATGPGTALALKQHNLPCDNCPEKDFNDRGLLKLAALQNIKQKKILIIKGEGGRLYLAKSLKARGAQIENLNVYKRQLPKIDTAAIPNQ